MAARKFRVAVHEKVCVGSNRYEYHPRHDLTVVVEGDVFSTAKRTFKLGIQDDPKFAGLELVSLRVRDRSSLVALVQARGLGGNFKIPGAVRRVAPR
jgi:hypothetical protein